MSARSRILLVTVTAVALLAFATSAQAVTRYQSSKLSVVVSSDTTLVTRATKQIHVHVEVTARSRKIALGVEAKGPNFKRVIAGKLVREGPTIYVSRTRSSRGDNFFMYAGGGGFSRTVCGDAFSGRILAHGGNDSEYSDRGFELKPRQSVSFDYTYDVSTDVPWLGADYTPIINLTPIELEIEPGYRVVDRGVLTLRNEVQVRPPTVAVAGPYAARIDVDSIPASKPGTPVTVGGTLVPAQAGKTIVVSSTRRPPYPNPFTDPPVQLGSAVTDAQGHFSLPGVLVPIAKSSYGLSFTYPEQPGDLVADDMCSVGFYAGSALTAPWEPKHG